MSNDQPTGPERTEATGMPVWVRRMFWVVVVLIVAMVLIMLVTGGQHGPGMHAARDFLSTLQSGELPR